MILPETYVVWYHNKGFKRGTRRAAKLIYELKLNGRRTIRNIKEYPKPSLI
jgi:uncharacterized protein (DUF3820 family)